jgi:predicted nucleotidyltransferase
MQEFNSSIIKSKIKKFCQRNHINRLALFGSVLNGSIQADSDVDVLVEFEFGHTPGLAFIRMQDELSEIFDGREIDLVTPNFLNRRIREKVIDEAVVQYEKK